jgi:DNA-binding NarL/FixJ family response regulator
MSAVPLRVFLCDDSDGAIFMARSRIAAFADVEFVGEARARGECLDAIVRARPDVALVDHALVAHVEASDIERLRSETPGTALLLYSAVADDIVEQEVLELGLDGFLSKRATEEEFEAAIRRHGRTDAS